MERATNYFVHFLISSTEEYTFLYNNLQKVMKNTPAVHFDKIL